MTSDITWGVATAAFQIEGATTEGDRGPSHWDAFQQQSQAEEGGWPARSTAEAFGQYAPRVLAELGELAQSRITINDPFCWSCMGNLEWSWGCSMRFGLVRIDFGT